MKTGLVSVTFRKLQPEDIIKLAIETGLDGIEWGGDIHVPHGNTSRAYEVAKVSRNSGIEVASYGSYYFAGCINEKAGSFERTLETAAALGAPNIRIWAGNKSSESADEEWWQRVIEDSVIAAEMAKKYNITVSYEFHANTLTDTNESCKSLLEKVNHNNMKCYWQPDFAIDFNERINGLKEIMPWITNIHAFHCHDKDKMPLAEGINEWKSYLKEIEAFNGDRYVILEFVKDESIEQFKEDASVLNKLVKK